MGRCTENTQSISDIWKTDTDTVVGIWNTEKYQIPTIKYRKVGSVRHFSTSMDCELRGVNGGGIGEMHPPIILARGIQCLSSPLAAVAIGFNDLHL